MKTLLSLIPKNLKKQLTKKNIFLGAITLFILMGLPLLVVVNSQQQNLKSNAFGAANIEAESTVMTGNVTVISDANASGGKYTKLGTASGTLITPESFGAVGNGVTDDTIALQNALDSLTSGQTLQFAAGKSYRHTAVLHIKKAGAHLNGPGTLLATNPQQSSVWIEADNVTLDGNLVLKMIGSTPRLEAEENHKLTIEHRSGTILRNITIDGSAAAGIFVNGASNYLFEDVTVQNTLADGIHNTNNSNNGTITRPIIRNVGDDGVAVVSYFKDGGLCHDITIDSPKLYGQTHGRAFTVVGGQNITYKNVYAENSSAAALYVASEGTPYFTYAAMNVKYLGGTLINSNQDITVDHGAILVTTYNPGQISSDIVFQDINIQNTRSTASRQVGLLSENGGANQRIQFNNVTITGGPTNVFSHTGTLDSAYNTVDWTYNGTHLPNHIGF
jgi:hypothetical protein